VSQHLAKLRTITPLGGEPLQRLVSDLATDPGFAVNIAHLTVEGRCQTCLSGADHDSNLTARVR